MAAEVLDCEPDDITVFEKTEFQDASPFMIQVHMPHQPPTLQEWPHKCST